MKISRKDYESYYEYEKALLKRRIILFKKRNPQIAENNYPEKLIALFEKYIEIYGHAYCMDVKSERGKTSKLIYALLCELKKHE